MNNRKRLTEKIRMLPSIRNLQLNEIIGMQKTASALGEKRAYAEELDVRKKLVVKAKQYYGEDALETFDAMSDLAFSFQDLYHFDEAFAIRKDSLEKCKELFGEHHSATAMAMYFMANTLNAMGRYHEALSYDYEAYMDRLGLLGTRDIDTIRAATNLAASYADIGDYKTSLFYLKKAQEYVAEIYDTDSDVIVEKSLDITARTATILGDMEKYEEALHLYEKVEKEYEQRFGPCHENTLMMIRRVSLTLSHLGKHEKAKSNLTKLLGLEEQVFGADDYETLWTMTGLGCVLDELGEYEESKKLHEQVLNKKRAFYGEKHQAYIMALSNWAYACHRSSDTVQGSMCIRLLEQALTDDLIENAEDKIRITDVLVHLYIDIGEYEKAAGLSSQMIDSAEYHYFYKKKFLAEKYDTAKLAFEKAGYPEKTREYEYKKTHMDELIYSGKPLCGMKLKAKEEYGISLTKGKVYELLGTEKVGGSLLYSIIDDEEFGLYLYGPGEFEVVEDVEEECFMPHKDTVKVVEFQQVPLCDYNDMKATILEDGTFHISGVDETWKCLAFMTFDDDGNDKDDYDFDYEFSKRATKILFALLQGKDPDEVETDADLKEILNLDVIKERFASKEGVEKLFEFCHHYGIQYTRRNY